MLLALRFALTACLLGLASLCCAAAKPNLVLVTLDSARADRMGFLGAKTGLTPNLDLFARESLTFEHAYAQAPSTVVSHATILSGTYPQATGITEIGGALPATLPYLPDLLRGQGYRTAAFVTSYQLDPRNGLAQGFERGFQSYAVGPPLAGAIAWLSHTASGPFFLWIHLSGSAPSVSYNSSLTAADGTIAKLIAALKQERVYATTGILVVADHGESLGAHGEQTHGIFLYDEAIHVPLLLKLPEAQPIPKRVATKVRLVDIAPTLLEIAGVPVPSQMQGQSLLRIARASGGADQPVYSRSEHPQRGFGWSLLESWRAGKYLYIRAPKPELYDLTADPGATRNLAQTSKATLDTMAAQLESFDRRFSGDAGKAQGAELNSSEMQKLASLGYVGLQKAAGASTTVTGTDPKDKIAIANKVIEAAEAVPYPPVVETRDRTASAKLDRAIAALQPIVAADPNLYLAQYALGVALAGKGRYDDAAKHLHRAIELQPDSAWAHYAMGMTLLKTGNYKAASVHLEIAATRLPNFASAREALAQAHEHLGRGEDAKQQRARTEK